VEGSRRLGGLLSRFADREPDLRRRFLLISDETESYPIGAELRSMWDPEALARLDTRMEAYLAEVRDELLEACREIVRKYGSHRGDLEVLRQFVRGERPWTDLAPLGVSVERHGGRYEIRWLSDLSLPLESRDVAAGLLALRHDPERRRSWADILLGMSFLELDRTLVGPEGESLLAALWDAAAGREPSPSAMAVADMLGADRSE
jgi:hypothetical protein